jgi:dephospho-CoA kinase
MKIAGLTGSIAMGKSETARMFRELDVPVFDADATVHELYAKGGAAVTPVGAIFPDAIIGNSVDRQKLAEQVLGDGAAMKKLESIVHPLVRQAREDFITVAKRKGHALVVLDIPLLFETGHDGHMDTIIVVSAPIDVQRRRALERPGMSVEKFENILSRQISDAEKRKKADYVVDSGKGLDHAFDQVRQIVQDLSASG